MEAQYELLRQFISCVKANPDILHKPQIAFFKEYLESLGATIPAPAAAPEPKPQPAKEAAPEPASEPAAEPEEEEEPAIPYPELDVSGVVEPDAGEELPMGEDGKEVSEDDLEKSTDARTSAQQAFGEGEFDKALEHFTTAITLNPGSALLHAKRANVLLKLKRPNAAIIDCEKAIKINPDSAQAYKFRGRANRLLGKWIEAHTDLATACRLDYDDVANEWLKEVEPNAKKLQEYNRAVARQNEEKELKERRERVRKAQEANRKAAEEAAKMEAEFGDDGPMGGGFPGGAAGFGNLFNDPEIAAALQDPEVLPAFMDISQNPANLMKYQNNPKVMKLIAKMQGSFGGPGGCSGGNCGPECHDEPADEPTAPTGASSAPPPTKVPEPDLD